MLRTPTDGVASKLPDTQKKLEDDANFSFFLAGKICTRLSRDLRNITGSHFSI